MQVDQVRAQDAKEWFTKAAQDLRRVEILLAVDPPDLEDALFHSQQTAEKALKGFLTWHDVAFRKVHELDEVGGQCVELDRTLAPLVQRTDKLTTYAWRFRYPGAPYQATLEEAHSAAGLAREVLDAILSRVPAGVRP